MATFLALAQKLRSEAGLSGTGPSAVTSQSGMDKKCVDWINDAWYEIQSAHTNWKWMWENDGMVTMVAGQREYDISSFTVQSPVRDSFRSCVSGNTGTDMWCTWYEYDEFRETFLFGTPTSGSQPLAVTISPAGTLLVDPVPNSASTYEVRFEYYIVPSLLVAATDVPGMPLRFHDMIMYRALMKYASHDGAAEVYADAQANYEKWERRLETDQLETVIQAGTLV